MICRRNNLFMERFMQYVIIAVVSVMIICILIGLVSFSGSRSEASNDMSYKYYTSVEIKNGDTLWDIATEHITGEYGSLQEYVNEVKELNNLRNDNIHTGQSLIIPYYSAEIK